MKANKALLDYLEYQTKHPKEFIDNREKVLNYLCNKRKNKNECKRS